MARASKVKPDRKRLLALIGAGVALVVVCAGGLYAYQQSKAPKTTSVTPQSSGSVNYAPADSQDNASIEQSKSRPPAGTPTPTPTVSAGATPNPIGVQITGANVQSGNVHIGTLVSGTDTGDCVLTAAKAGGSPVQLASSSVSLNVNQYSCGVYNVPTSAFSSSGSWELTLSVTNGSAKGTGVYNVEIP